MDNIAIFLVEGEKLDMLLAEEIERKFFDNGREIKILPYKTNIYNLYSQLKEDDFETDIISILIEKNPNDDVLNSIENRDNVSEIFLFFDYDGHNFQQEENCKEKTSDILSEMVKFFDNETENGKLYLSYPMIEAIQHCSKKDIHELTYKANYINAFTKRHIGKKTYKHISCTNSKFILPQKIKYSESEWNFIISNFLWGLSHMRKLVDYLDYSDYIENNTTQKIYEMQYDLNIATNDKILVLSGYPQFILDYFGLSLYNKIVKNQKFFTKTVITDFQ